MSRRSLGNGRLTLGLRTGDYREDGVDPIREVAPAAGVRGHGTPT